MAYSLSAFIIWGLFPLYFHLLSSVDGMHILAERFVWTLVFMVGLLTLRRQWQWLGAVLKSPRTLVYFVVTSFMMAMTWGLYVYGVQHGQVLEVSLGYFISPLISVLLGHLVLHEKLFPLQKGALGLAFVAVAWLTWQAGAFPWLGIIMGACFSVYGLMRKMAEMGPLEGLTLETMVMCPLALVWLVHEMLTTGGGVFINSGWDIRVLLMLGGPVTAIPLLLFAAGAKKLPFVVVGILQYISPTMQFLLGIWFFHESFGHAQLFGYALIWLALVMFTAEGARHMWKLSDRNKPAKQT